MSFRLNENCDLSLINLENRSNFHKFNAIPWQKDNEKIIIAARNESDELIGWAKSYYKSYEIVICEKSKISDALNKAFSSLGTYDAVNELLKNTPEYSANNLLKDYCGVVNAVVLVSIVAMVLLYPLESIATFFLIMSVLYVSTLTFKTIVFFIGSVKNKFTPISNEHTKIPDSELPIYTILLPLYKEDKVLGKLINSLRNLNYPKEKLDIKIIAEADDDVTLKAISRFKLDEMFHVVKVPYSFPRTKPKACNYALKSAIGDFVTIYDAEDIPDKMQLKKALYQFMNEDEKLVCVQAKLNYFNYNENWLSRLFAIEHSTLFDFLLPGLQAVNVPIPLGGTSNHFRMSALKELRGWDPYNVTEDADLGIRIYQKGWRCVLIDSTTMEESPVDVWEWVRQRSRWIKGHLQTYFVHMRSPIKLYKKVGMLGFVGVQFFLGAPALIFFISPFMWASWLLFVTGVLQIPQSMPDWFFTTIYFSSGILIAGIFLHIIYAIFAIKYRKLNDLGLYVFVFPFYWVLHSIASFRSVWQLITKPYYWEKTNHG